MQSLMFVFIGIPENNPAPDLGILKERLDAKYKASEIAVPFTRKDELLTAELGEVSFYISFLKSKDELNDWYQLATDFELMLATSPVTKAELLQRYDELKRSLPNLYSKIHYATAISIFDEINKFKDVSIISFQ